MRPVCVVVHPPRFQLLSGVFQPEEQMHIQTFNAQPAVDLLYALQEFRIVNREVN
jgi:hypothetical protein